MIQENKEDLISYSVLQDLYNYLHNTGTGCFNEMLFALINKADLANKSKLYDAFPEQSRAWCAYYNNGLKWLREVTDNN